MVSLRLRNRRSYLTTMSLQRRLRSVSEYRRGSLLPDAFTRSSQAPSSMILTWTKSTSFSTTRALIPKFGLLSRTRTIQICLSTPSGTSIFVIKRFSLAHTSCRVWVIGIAWAILIPGLNQFFFFRFPSVTIGALVAQLLSFPVGRAAAFMLPRKRIFGISLNPGPFNVKEHVLITVSW